MPGAGLAVAASRAPATSRASDTMQAPPGGIRFGFGIYPYDRLSIDDLSTVARRADELGYYAITFPEHLLPPRRADTSLHNRTWFDIPTLAAYLAAQTSRLRFYMNVLVLPYYHPVRLAKALATLDVVSGGRIICGVGAGWLEDEFERLGLPFAERGDMTDEYLRAMRALWEEDAPRFEGRYVGFDDVSFLPKPVQRPLPLIIGGTGPRPFRRVAELGDGWAPSVGTHDEHIAALGQIRRELENVGRDPSGMLFGSAVTVGVNEDAREAARTHARGSGEEMEEDAAPPAVRTREAVIADIERLRDVGFNFVSVGFSWETASDIERELGRFAAEIMSQFATRRPG
jgi:probable F420-dependent oxidoreductase